MTPMTSLAPARSRLARGLCLAALSTTVWSAAPAASPVGSPSANDPHRGGTLRLRQEEAFGPILLRSTQTDPEGETDDDV